MSTTSPKPSSLPSGVSPPPTVITSQNQNGVIAIITGFALGMVLLSTCIKLYARKYFRNFRHDDVTFTLAIVFVIIQSSLVFYEIHDGLGVALEDLSWGNKMTIRNVNLPSHTISSNSRSHADSLSAGLAADLFYILILFLSKVCCALFFIWLAPDKRHKNIA